MQDGYLYSDIIKIKTRSCEEYSSANNIYALTKEDFDIFNNELLNIRLLILIGLLNENDSCQKLEISEKQFIELNCRSLAYVLRHNGFSSEKAEKIVYKFIHLYGEFIEYLNTITKHAIIENGYVFYICRYYSAKINIKHKNIQKSRDVDGIIEKNMYLVKTIFNEIFIKSEVITAI